MSKIKYNKNGIPKYNKIRKMCWEVTKYIKMSILYGPNPQYNHREMLCCWICGIKARLFTKAQVKKMFLKGTKINY